MNKNYLIIAVLMSVGMMTSCTSSDTEENATGSPAVVNLNLGLQTRASATSAMPTSAVVYGTDEGKVNKYYVGLFDAAGGKVTIDTSTPTLISTTTQVRNILVAANTINSTTDKAAFSGCTTMTAFKANTADLSYTTSIDGQSNTARSTKSSQKTSGLPMFGQQLSTNFFSVTTAPTVNIALTHLVARIDLNSLTSNFASSIAYPTATFTVKEIFMYNVNDQCSYDGTTPTSGIAESGTTGKCEQTDASGVETLNANAYLSTGALTLSGPTYVSATAPYYFYVFPHSATNPTKLIIKGIFKANASDINGTMVYYPIIINDTGMSTTTMTNNDVIDPNHVYSLSVTLQGRGVADPSQAIVPSTTSVTLTVSNWANSTQTVIVN